MASHPLYDSPEWFRTTLASIGDAVLVTDSAGRVTFLNPVAATLTGWPATEAVGHDITEVFRIVNESTRAVVEHPVGQVLREGTVVGLANHTLLLGRDGVERPIDDSGAPIRDAHGRPVGVVLVFRDITERRRAEEARTRLAAIVESSDDAIISKTLDGIITSWNQGAERLFGYTATEIVGQPITRLMPPDLADDFPRIMARLRRGERVHHYETQRLAQDGTRLDVALTISPLRDGAGHLIGASKIARDITARKRAEADLARQRRETATLAAIAQGLSASLDLETILERVAAGAQVLCGSERTLMMLRDPHSDAVVGWYDMGPPTMASADLRIEPGKGLGGQVLLTGRPWRTEDYAADPRFSKEYLPGARASGHLAVVAVPILVGDRVEGLLYASNPATHPFTDGDEAILVRLATHAAIAMQNAQLYRQAQTEVVERRRAEAALQQAYATLEQRVAERTIALQQALAERQRLEEATRRAEHFALLGRLAAGVSHEIRNPLAAVFLHVEVLTEELHAPSADTAAVVPETLAEITANLRRLDDLVQDYLTLARVTSLQREVQPLGQAVQAWGAEWQPELAARGVTLQWQGMDTLGHVAFHPSTLRRALLNLVQNAADAMPQGGTVTLAGQGTPTQVQLRVQDTGSGIAVAHLGQILEPLYTTKPGGTGLGLYIVQEIVTAHGGHITVESMPGQGTTFTLTLPRAPGDASRADAAPHAPATLEEPDRPQ